MTYINVHTSAMQDAWDSSRLVDVRPHCHLMSPFYRTPANIQINFILPGTRVHAKDLYLWQYVSTFISFYAIIFQSCTVGSQKNWCENRIQHSSEMGFPWSAIHSFFSFKIAIQGHTFWDHWKLHVNTVYNNASLISKVSGEIASKKAENCRCRQPHCCLTPHPQGTPASIHIHLISPETNVIGSLHFYCWLYMSIFIQIFVVGSVRCILSATECISAVQGHPRSLIMAPIERTYANSY